MNIDIRKMQCNENDNKHTKIHTNMNRIIHNKKNNKGDKRKYDKFVN